MGSFSVLDYSIIAVYLIATVVIGLRFTRRQENVEDYFVAGRSAPSWAVAISAIATGLSAISYLGVPAWVFENELQLNVSILLLPISAWIVVVLFVPAVAGVSASSSFIAAVASSASRAASSSGLSGRGA